MLAITLDLQETAWQNLIQLNYFENYPVIHVEGLHFIEHTQGDGWFTPEDKRIDELIQLHSAHNIEVEIAILNAKYLKQNLDEIDQALFGNNNGEE